MNLADVMAELAEAVRSVPSLAGKTYDFPNESPPDPAAIVPFPEEIEFDNTGGRGSDVMSLDVVVLVGRMSDRGTQQRATGYADGSGAESIKAAIEGHTYTALDSVRVETCRFESYTVAQTNHLALIFTLDIIGSGTS